MVAGEDDRFLPHAGYKIVTRPGHVALMAGKEPGAGEDLLLLLLIDLLADEDLAADQPVFDIDETVDRVARRAPGHRSSPPFFPPFAR